MVSVAMIEAFYRRSIDDQIDAMPTRRSRLARCITASAEARCWPTCQWSNQVLKMRRLASGERFLLLARPKLVGDF
jgi:hypothetical protein